MISHLNICTMFILTALAYVSRKDFLNDAMWGQINNPPFLGFETICSFREERKRGGIILVILLRMLLSQMNFSENIRDYLEIKTLLLLPKRISNIKLFSYPTSNERTPKTKQQYAPIKL